MSFSLRILPRAERDAQFIFGYISERSANGARRWWEAFQHAVERVSENPDRFGYAPENHLSDFELRQFLFKTRLGRNYRGIFAVVGDEIRILRVRGPGQASLESDELSFS